jgi:phosphatidylethanolamine-binding protein (PEBP) family uncharacterized protein
MFKKMLLRMALIICAASLAGCGNIPQIMGESGAQNTPVIPPAQQNTSERSPSTLAGDSVTATATSGFTLTSPTVVEGGILPAEYTCDGLSATLALTWSEAPVGTQSFAVVMHHVASPEDVHWYWILYDIPAIVTNLPKNSHGIGTLGINSVNDRTEYTPPCSKGPGPKVYTYTIYALSAEPQFSVPSSQVSRDVLLEAIRNITLASAELHVTYTRK